MDARARAHLLPSPGKRGVAAGPGRRTLRASPGPAPAADSEPLPAPSEVTTDAAAGLQSPRPFGGRGAEGSLAEGTQHPAPAHAARSLSADHRTVPAAPRCRRGARAACFFGFWEPEGNFVTSGRRAEPRLTSGHSWSLRPPASPATHRPRESGLVRTLSFPIYLCPTFLPE